MMSRLHCFEQFHCDPSSIHSLALSGRSLAGNRLTDTRRPERSGSPVSQATIAWRCESIYTYRNPRIAYTSRLSMRKSVNFFFIVRCGRSTLRSRQPVRSTLIPLFVLSVRSSGLKSDRHHELNFLLLILSLYSYNTVTDWSLQISDEIVYAWAPIEGGTYVGAVGRDKLKILL